VKRKKHTSGKVAREIPSKDTQKWYKLLAQLAHLAEVLDVTEVYLLLLNTVGTKTSFLNAYLGYQFRLITAIIRP
jgi:hypothetical protein